MPSLRSLAKDTMIYGMSSIVGRFLNYLLVPIHTYKMAAEGGGYGVITNVYSWVALTLVICIFGMETTIFRYANDAKSDPRAVFSNAFWVVATLAGLMLAGVLLNLRSVAGALNYGDMPWILGSMAIVTALDSVQAVLFAWLRFMKRPIRFATLKLLFIFCSIALNLLFYTILGCSDPDMACYINLACTLVVTLFLIPEFRLVRFHIDRPLLRRMLSYSWPLLLLGIAGILNQTADKIIFPFVYPDEAEGRSLLGIYGACVKIAMIMAMITQAFRFAYEPFVFGSTREADAKTKYAVAMKYFIIFTLLAYLCVIAGLPVLRYFIQAKYWEGLSVVPIVMAAEIMMGVYFNLSFWYKLTDRNIYGAWFSLAGCSVLIAVNVLGVPRYGYMACAWGGVAGYGTAMLLSYFVGRVKNPFPYDLASIFSYVLLTAVCHVAMVYIPRWLALTDILTLAFSALIILAFAAHIWFWEFRRRRA